MWLYVGKAKLESTESMVREYLEKRFPGREFVVSKVERQSVSTSSFKVGADFDLKDDLYRAETWPSGIMIRRFNFRTEKKQHESEAEF